MEACDPTTAPAVTFDAGYSSDPSGRKLTSLAWGQETSGVMNPMLDSIITEINSRADLTAMSQLKINQTTIATLDVGSYTLTVTVSSFLNQVATGKLTFRKEPSGAVPVVSIIGGSAQSFQIGDGLKVSSQLQPTSVCGGKEVRLACFVRVAFVVYEVRSLHRLMPAAE